MARHANEGQMEYDTEMYEKPPAISPELCRQLGIFALDTVVSVREPERHLYDDVEASLRCKIIGQDAAIEAIMNALDREKSCAIQIDHLRP